jgi:hypothetical protein
MLERQDMPFQERFLGLGAERDMKRPPRMRQAHHEHPALNALPGDSRPELAEVNLGLRCPEPGR